MHTILFLPRALSLCSIWLTFSCNAFVFALVLLGLLAISLFCFAHTRKLPFADPTMNRFELLSLVVSYFTFFFGILTLDSALGGVYEYASVLAMILNVAYLCAFLAFGVHIYRQEQLQQAQASSKNLSASMTGESAVSEGTQSFEQKTNVPRALPMLL